MVRKSSRAPSQRNFDSFCYLKFGSGCPLEMRKPDRDGGRRGRELFQQKKIRDRKCTHGPCRAANFCKEPYLLTREFTRDIVAPVRYEIWRFSVNDILKVIKAPTGMYRVIEYRDARDGRLPVSKGDYSELNKAREVISLLEERDDLHGIDDGHPSYEVRDDQAQIVR